MAFAVKYRMDWTPLRSTLTNRVDIERDGYGGSIIELGHTENSFEQTYSEGKWISQSEAYISFHVEDSDTSSYDDDFFNTVYKEIKIKHYIDGNLEFVGWLKPENTFREFSRPHVIYKISASDGLAELKSIKYEGFETIGRQTPLQIIKNALDFSGIDDLDFFIQCSLREVNFMAAGEQLFTSVFQSNRAFYHSSNNQQVAKSCYEVIEACVKSYYCSFKQVRGFWKITNGQEFNSQSDVFDYDTLDPITGQTDVSYDRSVDIGDFHTPSRGPF
jgi:hypothetical protein